MRWSALGSKAAKQEYLQRALEGLRQEAAAAVGRRPRWGRRCHRRRELMAMKMPALRARSWRRRGGALCGAGGVSSGGWTKADVGGRFHRKAYNVWCK